MYFFTEETKSGVDKPLVALSSIQEKRAFLLNSYSEVVST
jgi:hypothetical protein